MYSNPNTSDGRAVFVQTEGQVPQPTGGELSHVLGMSNSK